MEQETILKGILFSIVILDHINRLHILFKATKQKSFNEFVFIFLKASLNFLDFIFLMERKVLIDNTCHQIIFKVNLFSKELFYNCEFFVTIKLVEEFAHVLPKVCLYKDVRESVCQRGFNVAKLIGFFV